MSTTRLTPEEENFLFISTAYNELTEVLIKIVSKHALEHVTDAEKNPSNIALAIGFVNTFIYV